MLPSVGAIVKSLGDCAWLDAERARACARILLAFTVIGAVSWIALSATSLNSESKLIGTDFVGVYTASLLALEGHPDRVYDVSAHWAAQKALCGPNAGYTAFFYPPPALLVYWPLALAPYLISLAAWLSATGFAFYRVLRGYLPSLEVVAFFAFPAVFMNAAHGQNGFLSAALIGGGLLVMDRSPKLAGACFGAMLFKPHLALAIPFGLIFARRWTTLLVAAATAAALGVVSLVAFGAWTWSGFFAGASLARRALENNLVGNERMESVFAAVRLLHGSLALAWGAQALAAAGAITALWLLQRRAFRTAGEAPAVVCAGLLASPYVLDYDLTLLAIPLVWLLGEGLRSGFLPFEKAVMALAFALPVISLIVAGAFGLPLAPLTIGALLALILRRALKPAADRAGRVALDADLRIRLSPAAEPW